MAEEDIKVDVSPDMGMYRILPQQGYDPAFALAEFVDNALHAFQHKPDELSEEILTVTLHFFTNEYEKDKAKSNSIEITDNGPGMFKSELANAFKPAKKPDIAGLSEFGIGMKAAAVWFTDTWTLITKNKSEPEYHTVEFDLPTLLKQGKSEILVGDSKKYASPHGTYITLRGLRSRRQFDKEKVDLICRTLSEIYQKFTDVDDPSRKLKLLATIDGGNIRELVYKPHTDNTPLVSELNKWVTRNGKKTYYAIGNERRWFKKISFDYTYEGVTSNVTGFIYILKTARYGNKNQGLVYFRNGRVILGTHEKENKPKKLYITNNKFRAQRLYGELNIDGLPVTYTKDGIDFDEDAFIEKLMEDDEISLFCQQCENHRVDIEAKEIVYIDTEDDIPPPSKVPPKNNKPTGTAKPRQPKTQKPKTTKEKIFEYLEKLKESENSTLTIDAFINELRWQLVAERPISASLSLRVVLEKGILKRIKKDFSQFYGRVETFGIQALINHMVDNKSNFFTPGDDEVFKCAQTNSKSRHFADILVVNNVSHGGFAPQMGEIESMISNLQPLLNWAYDI